MKQDLLKTVKKYQMLKKGDSVYVGVSGGPDSVALFHVFYGLKKELGLKEVGIIHVNHMLRDEEADKDQQFVESLAKQFKVPFIIGRVNVKEVQKKYRYSVEEAARVGRFQFMRREARKRAISHIALAHTQDDQAETVLMRIIRGTGLRGFQAIRPVLNYDEVTFIRPLIEVKKDVLMDYLKQEALTYRIDSSNFSTRFTRNRIRLDLIPEIEKNFNPRIKEVLARLPEAVGMDIGFIDQVTDQQFDEVLKKTDEEDVITLKKNVLEKLPEAIQFRIFNKVIGMLSPNTELDFYHWNEIRKGVHDKTHFQVSLPDNTLITFERKEIQVSKKLNENVNKYQYKLELGKRIFLKEYNLNFSCELFEKKIYKVKKDDRRYEIFDYDKLKFPLVIRNRKPGDVFQPLGMDGKKKLKDYFIDRKVSVREKSYLPLFFSGNKLIWIYGLGIAGSAAVTSKTKRFIKISSFEAPRPTRPYKKSFPYKRNTRRPARKPYNRSNQSGQQGKSSSPSTQTKSTPQSKPSNQSSQPKK